jgi:cystathionine beta-lyase
MDAFDFDAAIDRRPTSSTKWNRYKGRDIIPLWVADMDFRCAPEIVEALRARVAHGVFGYTEPPEALGPTIVAALERDHGWRIQPDWIVWLPSLVVGLNVVSRAFAEEGDDVLTAVPIYPPFLSAPRYGGRNVVMVLLREAAYPSPQPSPARGEGVSFSPQPSPARGKGGSPSPQPSPARGEGVWSWDMAALEAAIGPRSRVLLLCSPHNPTGRVWTRSELEGLAQFAAKHDLIVVSDEIHAGLVLDADKRHLPFASLSGEIDERTVTLMSASKTFNVPTLGCAFAIASNEQLRARLKRTMAGIVHHVGGLGYLSTLAAYRDGRSWQLALLDYLRSNRDLVERKVGAMRGLRTWHVEATYLAWIDARGLGVADPVKFFEDAGVGLYDGALFGTPGFVRLNFACPRALLGEALRRMEGATVGAV